METFNYISNQQMSKIFFSAGSLLLLGLFLYRRKQRNNLEIPTQWTAVGTVKSLMIYPLKSGRRMLIERAMCTEVGMQMPENETLFQLRDRDFIVYREDNSSFERTPKMLKIKLTSLNKNQVILEAPGMEKLTITRPCRTETRTQAITLLRHEKTSALDCGDEAAKWLSTYILNKENGLRLGFTNSLWKRNLQEAYKEYLNDYPVMKNDVSGLYSNITSYMVLTQGSVDDINSKITDHDITEHNFRPNILVDGTKPFAEDNWKWIKIGDVILYMVKYCTRCAFVTVDPETLERNNNLEPLKTMKTYRQLKDLKNINVDGTHCVMGLNMALKQGGEIRVGDVVYASEH